MTTRIVHDSTLVGLNSEVDRIDEDVRALQQSMREPDLHRTSSTGGWTVAQVFEHLIIANTIYYDAMDKVLARAERVAIRPGSAPWRASFIGRLLIQSMSPNATRKLPAPRILKPGHEPRADVVQAFLESQEGFRVLTRRADGRDVSRIRMSSPVSRLIRINLGDAFRIIVVHEQRHLQQIRRILDAVR